MLFKRCLAQNCRKIIWFSESIFCAKCEKEVTQILLRIGRSRNGGNQTAISAQANEYFDQLENFKIFNVLVNDIPIQPESREECRIKHIDSTPSHSSNDHSGFGSCSGGGWSSSDNSNYSND